MKVGFKGVKIIQVCFCDELVAMGNGLYFIIKDTIYPVLIIPFTPITPLCII